MLLKCCLNGAREQTAGQNIPQTPAELAAAAAQAVAAGAGAIHLHPRDADGRQSLTARDVVAAVAAVRAACSGVPVGVTTIATIEPDLERRLALLDQWQGGPDFTSVNFGEDGAVEVCQVLLQRGVGIEPGIATAAEARLLVEARLAPRSMRILLEPDEQDLHQALATVAAIEAILDAAGITAPRLLHGFDATAWPLLAEAVRRGLDTRIGLEDTRMLPDGSLAPDNAALVAAARAIAHRAGRT